MMGTMAKDFLRELVQIKSITFHEEEAARYLEEKLNALGFTTTWWR